MGTQAVVQFGTESVSSLAGRIKAKYPDYAGIEDGELVRRIITKYPEYQRRLSGEALQGLTRPSEAATQPGFFTKPLISPETVGKLPSMGARTQAEAFQAKDVNEEIAHWEKMTEVATRAGNREAAGKYDELAKNLRGLRDTVSGFTSPAMIGMIGAGPILSKLRAPGAIQAPAGFVPSAWFLGKGAEEVTAPAKAGETEADILQRRLGGTTSMVMGTAGMKATLPATAATITGIGQLGKAAVGRAVPRPIDAAQLKILSGLKPSKGQAQNVRLALQNGSEDLMETERQAQKVDPRAKIDSVSTGLSAVRQTLDRLWGEFQSLFPGDESKINNERILADIGQIATPEMGTANPRTYSALGRIAQRLRLPMTLEQAEKQLEALNKEANPEEGNAPEYAARALRTEINQRLSEASGGGDVQGLKRRIGAQMKLQSAFQEVEKKMLADAGKTGLTTYVRPYILGRTLADMASLMAGNPSAAWGVARGVGEMGLMSYFKNRALPDNLVARGFKGLRKQNLQAPPSIQRTPPVPPVAAPPAVQPTPAPVLPRYDYAPAPAAATPAPTVEPVVGPAEAAPPVEAAPAPPSPLSLALKARQNAGLVLNYLKNPDKYGPTSEAKAVGFIQRELGIDISGGENLVEAEAGLKQLAAGKKPAGGGVRAPTGPSPWSQAPETPPAVPPTAAPGSTVPIGEAQVPRPAIVAPPEEPGVGVSPSVEQHLAGMGYKTVSEAEAPLHNILVGSKNKASVPYKEISEYHAVANLGFTSDQVADYLEAHGKPVTGRPAIVAPPEAVEAAKPPEVGAKGKEVEAVKAKLERSRKAFAQRKLQRENAVGK